MAFGISMDADGVPTLFLSSETRAIHQWPLLTTRHDWSREKKGTPVVVTHLRTRKNQPLQFHERADGLVDAVFVGMVKRFERGREVRRPLLRSTLECGKKQTAEACYFAFANDAQSVTGLVQFMAQRRAERQMSHLFCTYADGRKKELALAGRPQAAAGSSGDDYPAVRCRRASIKECNRKQNKPMTTATSLDIETIQPGDPELSLITIDFEFQNLVPAISADERAQLEKNIVEAGGTRDPLTLWLRADDDFVLLDGHNRLEICKRLGLPFTYHRVNFNTRDEAADWIDRNQLGRRNLSRQDYKLLLGRRYNRATRQGERTDLTSGKSCPKSGERTSERIAKEHGVAEKTVRNAGKYQAAAEKLGIEKEIAAGNVKASESEVVKAAKALPDNPTTDEIKQARATVKAAAGKRRQAQQPEQPTAGESRRKNGRLADRITRSVLSIRDAVETLGATDSAYREQVLAELRRCVERLSRPQAASSAKPEKRQPDDELRVAVAERWEACRIWNKHWAIADMKDVRRFFIDLIREEQKQFDK